MTAFRLQNLDAADARLCLDIARFMTEELGLKLAGERLLLAVSGGADSTALLYILALLRTTLLVDLRVCTVDHGLRPSSAAEAEAVRAQCLTLRMEHSCCTAPVSAYSAEHGLGLEESGRILRYAALEDARQRLEADWIVTGHQLEDLGEDVLLRLLRGTGWPGLGGMSAVDEKRRILRPLLLTPGAALKGLLRRCVISWYEDESNANLYFRRNRLRHRIWPLLIEESPRFGEHIASLWRIARTDEEHWNKALAGLLPDSLGSLSLEEADAKAVVSATAGGRETGTAGTITLKRAVLCRLDKAGRLRLYMGAIARLRREHGGGQGRAVTLFALDEAWSKGRGGTLFQFPGGIRAELRQGNIRFLRETEVFRADLH